MSQLALAVTLLWQQLQSLVYNWTQLAGSVRTIAIYQVHGDPLDSQRILSREEKKRQTRQSLVEAALTLVGNGENFTGISIREVAKNAGVVPTSFYRHFTDMEELGLNIVDDLGMMLRRKLRAVRQTDGYSGELTRSSVQLFTDFVCLHRNHFYFMYQCRAGGTVRLRAAIRNELSFFANELASDIRQLHMLSEIDSADLQMVSQLIVAAVFESTTDLLDLVESSPTFRQEFVELTVKKLRLIWLGAERWRSRSPAT